MAGVNCTDMADENCTLRHVGDSICRIGEVDVREGEASAVTTLSGARAEQVGIGQEAGS